VFPRVACAVLATLVVPVLVMACGNRTPVEPPAPREPNGTQDTTPAVPGADVLRLYDDAASLDPLRLTTLASQEGLSALLTEAGREPKHRRAVLAALPYTKRLAAAEYLAQVAITGEKESELAFASLQELAALVKRNEDSEDLVELRRGCEVLGKFVTDGKGKKEQRARAMSCLRVLSQHGCTAPATTDYDAP
jgi:hypothetical protein